MAEFEIISHLMSHSPPPLNSGSVHIWHVNLAELFSISDAINCLDDNEQQRAKRFIFEHHRQRFIAAHYAVRRILQSYLAIDSSSIIFNHNQYGKPGIAACHNPQGIEFNLSHSEETALIAVRLKLPVGIDLEATSIRDFLGIAKHSFAESEYQAFSQLTLAEQSISFFHIWVQKEAFIKAVGKGLSYHLKDFTVTVLPPAGLLSTQEHDQQRWFIHSFTANKGIPAAVASLLPVDELVFLNF